MHWEDEGFILSVGKFSEAAALVQMFTRQHGLVRALAHGGVSRKQRGIYQPGNVIRARWSARLSDHMGTIQSELSMPIAAPAMTDRLTLTGLNAVVSLLPLSVMEQDPHPRLYDTACELLQAIARSDADWCAEYARFEVSLLQEAGYGLDVDTCVSTGVSAGLCYVSPKSGRAVSQQAGAPYHDKLLPLPMFLRADTEPNNPVKPAEILDALRMSGYFLDHWLLRPLGKELPAARRRLIEQIEALALSASS